MFQVDRATVEALNRIAQRQPLRLAALLAATYLLVIPIVILLGLVVAALRRPTHPLALAALSAAGAAGLLGLNQLAGHLHFRSARTGRCPPSTRSAAAKVSPLASGPAARWAGGAGGGRPAQTAPLSLLRERKALSRPGRGAARSG